MSGLKQYVQLRYKCIRGTYILKKYILEKEICSSLYKCIYIFFLLFLFIYIYNKETYKIELNTKFASFYDHTRYIEKYKIIQKLEICSKGIVQRVFL